MSAMTLTREVGHCVRALRKRRGLTQAALAELIDRSEVAVRAIERGASAPSFETLERLALALDIPAAGLFPVVRAGDEARLRETERRAREVAAVTALARSFDDPDLALALALLTAVARAVPERHGPEK
jgi:transcriptional regulator with XRE-family HTH domain